MDCSPPGSSVHGICQARVLEWVAIAFSGDPGNDPFFAHRRRGNQSDCIRLREDGDGDDDDDDDPNAPESTVEPEGVSAG